MATFEERAAKQAELEQILAEIENLRPDQVERLDLPPSINFTVAKPYLEETWRIYYDLGHTGLERASFTMLSQLIGVAQQTLATFRTMKGFAPAAQGNPQQRDAIFAQVRDYYETVFENVMKARAYLLKVTSDFDQIERDARSAVSRVAALIDEQQKSQETTEKSLAAQMADAQGVLETVRRSAAEVGVSRSAVFFREEALEHKESSRMWLIATGVLAGITVAFGVASYLYQTNAAADPSPWRAVQLTIAKLIVFSILASAVVWSGRIYRAHRHNFVVNKHRENALSTFQLFAEAAGDSQTKSAVLLQATQAIFAPQDTGYRAGDAEPPGSPQILEIIRGVGEGGRQG